MYTTNTIESLNNVIRKNIKRREFLPTDDSTTKIIFLVLQDASKN
ncbi:transposase [Nitrosomonas aestuarii]